MLSHRMGGRGRSSYLSEDQQGELIEEVSVGRFKTADEIRHWIERTYGVSYSLGGVSFRASPVIPLKIASATLTPSFPRRRESMP